MTALAMTLSTIFSSIVWMFIWGYFVREDPLYSIGMVIGASVTGMGIADCYWAYGLR